MRAMARVGATAAASEEHAQEDQAQHIRAMSLLEERRTLAVVTWLNLVAAAQTAHRAYRRLPGMYGGCCETHSVFWRDAS